MDPTDTGGDLVQLAGELAPDLQEWFAVGGDMDDFIFYGEAAKSHSER